MDLETPLESSVEDPQQIHQILEVNTEEMAFQTHLETPLEDPQVFETPIEMSIEDPQTVQDRGGL